MYDERESIEAELRRGEKVLWSGRGSAAGTFGRSIGLVLFGAVFAAFALFWMFMASFIGDRSGAGSAPPPPAGLFMWFGLPFVLVGIGLICSPMFQAVRARRMIYCVTTERAIVIYDGRIRHVTSYGPQDMTELERVEFKDGRGHVYFARSLAEVMPNSSRRRAGVSIKKRGFEGIEDPRGAESALRDLKSRGIPTAVRDA